MDAALVPPLCSGRPRLRAVVWNTDAHRQEGQPSMPHRNPASKTVSLPVASKVSAVADARRQVADAVRRWGPRVDPDVVETLELLAGEVIANAVVHTGSGCHVAVSWTGSCLRVEVEDSGPDLVPSPAPIPDDAECGRGLQLVECLATRWGSLPTTTGKTVWFEVDGRMPEVPRTPPGPHGAKPTGPVLPRAASAVRTGGGLARALPQIP
ncbi:ATP-binding protein [Kitasatospora albolonga]